MIRDLFHAFLDPGTIRTAKQFAAGKFWPRIAGVMK